MVILRLNSTYFSPHIFSTVISEEDLKGDTKKKYQEFQSFSLQKFYSNDSSSVNTQEITIAYISGNPLHNIVLTGIQNDHGKCYTQPLLFNALIPLDSPLAIINTCMTVAYTEEPTFQQDFQNLLNQKVHTFQEQQYAKVEIKIDCIHCKCKHHHEKLFVS